MDYFAVADRVLPGAGLGGYALPADARFIFSHGEGARVWTTDGRELVDYVCGAGALVFGHADARIVGAMTAQAQRGAHMFGVLSDVAVRLAQRLCEDIPSAERVAYATTGSEANAYAIRLARAYTQRNKIIKFEGAYHGNHDYTLVSTFPPQAGVYPKGAPDTSGHPEAVRELTLIAPYNDLAKTQQIAEAAGDDLAAIMVEPVQRIIRGDDDFLHGLRALCDRLGALLIFDEVVTGFRIAYGGAQVALGIAPDLSTFGKIIGGGGPLSAIAGRADILDLSNPHNKGKPNYAYFNGTLHGNPVAAAATLAALDALRPPEVLADLNTKTQDFCRAIQDILTQRKLPAIAVCCGSLWQILFTDTPPRRYADMLNCDVAAGKQLDIALLKSGQYTLPGVRRFLSTAHTTADCESYLTALANCPI